MTAPTRRTPLEGALLVAFVSVILAGSDPLLDEAARLIARARECVAKYEDQRIAVRGSAT